MRSAMGLTPDTAKGSCGLLRFAAAVLLLIQVANGQAKDKPDRAPQWQEIELEFNAGITSLEVPRAYRIYDPRSGTEVARAGCRTKCRSSSTADRPANHAWWSFPPRSLKRTERHA